MVRFAALTGIYGVTIGMTLPIIILAICKSVSGIAIASRQAVAFNRDNGLPFPSWFGKFMVVTDMP